MKNEATRTRKQGTRVTNSMSPSERILAIRRVVAEGQYAKVDGCMIDLFTAGAIVRVFDSISIEHQLKFSSKKAAEMGIIAFRVIAEAEHFASK